MYFVGKRPLLFFQLNPWKFLADNRWTDDGTAKRMGSELYNFILPICLGLIALSIVVLFIRYGMNRENRSGSLIKPLKMKLFFVVALAAFVYLVNLVWRIIDRFAAQLIMNA